MLLNTRALPVYLVLLMAGCAHNTVTSNTEPPYRSIDGTGKDPTTTWISHTRTGGAYSQSAYRQVLGNQNMGTISDLPTQSPRYSNKPADVIERANSLQSYSIYELARWQRYCGHDKMNAKDWDFVASQGRSNMPETLKSQCNSPAFTRSEYLAAWKRFCDGGTPSDFDQVIRTTTIAPGNNCRN
jgi:hypothetical protein